MRFAAFARRLIPFAALIVVPVSSAAHADQAAIARGAYLAAAAGCDQCHTDAAGHGAAYAGGRKLPTEFGALTTPNITPDRETGIGRWSAGDFERAMRWGVAPDDIRYATTFPFPYYNALSDADLADLKAFLDSLPPVRHPGVKPAEGLALLARARAAIAVAATASASAAKWRPDPAKDAVWNRGAYLVATVGRCGECHTPRDFFGRPEADQLLAGSDGWGGGQKGPNITPDPLTGIGNWNAGDILTLLTDGRTPDMEFVGGSMAEIVRNTARLTEADRHAIAVFLQSVPPKQRGKKR